MPEDSTTPSVSSDDAYNAQVGKQKASLSVIKGKFSGVFLSNISWENPKTSREYIVKVNLNLNDPANNKDRKYLLGVLAKNFDK